MISVANYRAVTRVAGGPRSLNSCFVVVMASHRDKSVYCRNRSVIADAVMPADMLTTVIGSSWRFFKDIHDNTRDKR